MSTFERNGGLPALDAMAQFDDMDRGRTENKPSRERTAGSLKSAPGKRHRFPALRRARA
jgi:hypothetical protein